VKSRKKKNKTKDVEHIYAELEGLTQKKGWVLSLTMEFFFYKSSVSLAFFVAFFVLPATSSNFALA